MNDFKKNLYLVGTVMFFAMMGDYLGIQIYKSYEGLSVPMFGFRFVGALSGLAFGLNFHRFMAIKRAP